MYRKTVVLSVFLLLMAFSITSQAALNLSDNFSIPRDYLKVGFAESIWDDMVFTNTTVLMADMNDRAVNNTNTGTLYLKSGGNSWDGAAGSRGELIYIEGVSGDFDARVKVVTNWPVPGNVWHNWTGIMARVAPADDTDPGDDWIQSTYFPLWNGNRGDLAGWGAGVNGFYFGRVGNTGAAAGRYIRLTRTGDVFNISYSSDGITYTPIVDGDNGNAPGGIGFTYSLGNVLRSDWTGKPVQIGLTHAVYSGAVTYHEFDDFSLTGTGSIVPNPYAHSPSPRNTATWITVSPTLKWKAGSYVQGTNGHELYLGTNFNDVNNRNVGLKHVLSTNSYPAGALLPDTIYYWCVDEINTGNPSSPWRGPVWSFRTGGKATNPNPSDMETAVDKNLPTLRWTPDVEAVTQDLYFSTNYYAVRDDTALIASGIAGDANSYSTPSLPLKDKRTYYWKISTHCGAGVSKGDIWKFSTGPEPMYDWQFGKYAPDGLAVTNGQSADRNWYDYMGNALPANGTYSWQAGGTPRYASYSTAELPVPALGDGWALNTGNGVGYSYFGNADSPTARVMQTRGPFSIWTRIKRLEARAEEQWIFGQIGAAFWGLAISSTDELLVRWGARTDATGLTIPVGTWKDIGVSYSGGPAGGTGLVKLYINGSLYGTYDSDAMAIPNDWFHVGARGSSTFRGFNLYDRIAFWNKAVGDDAFRTLSVIDVNAARNPSPANGATNVDALATMSWTAGANVQPTNGHYLYLSTDRYLVEARDVSIRHITSTASYNPGGLVLGATYYWVVDEINGASEWPGDIWSFTAEEGKATNPDPLNGKIGVSPDLTVVQWTPYHYAVSQKMYFSEDFNDVNDGLVTPVLLTGSASSTSIPIALDVMKTYYWRIETNSGTIGSTKGDVWSFITAYAVNICDDFEYDPPIDFLSTGTTGTIWDGIVGKDTLWTLATDYNANAGRLFMESGINAWSGNEQGVLLYKEIVGPFIATVEVTDYPNLWNPAHPDADTVWHNWGGIMARVGNLEAAGPGEDWITISYFPIWGNGNRGDLNGWYTTNYQIFFGRTWDAWNGGKFLQMDYKGNGVFYLRWSRDGLTWYPINSDDEPTVDGYTIMTNPTIKEDMAGLPLQVGLCHATYSADIGYMEFDNFCIGRELIAKAYSPLPNDGGGLDLMKPTLSWAPGDFAVTHNVYFGTDPNALINKGSGNVQGPDASGRFSYNAGQFETLVIGNTYYWRIDEVNVTHPSSPWQGDVWKFTVQDYSTIDGFEQYISTGYPAADRTLRKTWIDGYWSLTKIIPTPPVGQPQYKITSSASFLQLNLDKQDGGANPVALRYFNDANVALLGKKSMKLYYENDGFYQWMIWLYGLDSVIYKYPAPKFSEVAAAIDDAARLDATKHASLGLKRNWSGYKLLRIPFYGDPNNTIVATDKLYVGLWDGDNNPTAPVVTEHSDNTMLQKNWWHEWYIPLSSFPAANANFSLSNVARIYIGVGNRTTPATGGIGNLFFDEIRILASSICIAGSVKADFNGDCTVNEEDLQLMTELWLGQTPAGANPIIRLDASGLTVGNTVPSWTNSGTGLGKFDANTADAGAVPKVAMVDGRKAVVLDGNDFMIWRDASNQIIPAPASITGNSDWTVIIDAWNPAIADDEEILAWARRGTDANYAAANYGSSGAYGAVAHWGTADMGFDRGVPAAHQWHTIAVTFDGATETVVVDGLVNATEDKTLKIWDANAVVLGTYSVAASAPTTPGAVQWGNSWIVPARTIMYTGAVSKIEVYDYSMTPGQLAMKMGTPVNLFSSDTIINFKDFAVLANKWLVGPVLWP